MIRAECPSGSHHKCGARLRCAQLLRVHTAGYLIKHSDGYAWAARHLVRLGLPPCEGLLTRSRRENAPATVGRAMWAALEDGLGVQPRREARITPSRIADSATVCSTTSQSPSGTCTRSDPERRDFRDRYRCPSRQR